MIHAIQMKRPDGKSYSVMITASYSADAHYAHDNVKKSSTGKKDYDPCCVCIV